MRSYMTSGAACILDVDQINAFVPSRPLVGEETCSESNSFAEAFFAKIESDVM